MNNRHCRSRSLSLRQLPLAIALVSAWTLPAAAQNPAGGQDAKATELDRIVVSANKREELAKDAPISVTALNEEFLIRTRSVRFEDYITRVPAMSFLSARPGATQLILRGITSGASQPNATVGTYIDETPFGISNAFAGGSTMTPDLDTFDVQRLEVLRGPQGTHYGASTLGGLLKFVTNAPDPDGFYGRVEADASTVSAGGDGHAVRAMVNVPVGEKTALRASAYTREDAGYIDDSRRGRKDINGVTVDGGRIALETSASERLKLRLTALAQNIEADGVPGVYVDRQTLSPLLGDLTQARYTDEYSSAKYRLYNVTADYAFDGLSLVSVTSHGTLDATGRTDGTAVYGALLGGAGVAQGQVANQEKTTQEFRLQSTGERRLDWQAGLFYTRETTDYNSLLSAFNPLTQEPVAGLPVLFQAALPATFKEYAAFGNVTWHFTKTFDVLLGARYSRNEQTLTQSTSGYLNNPANPGAVTGFTVDSSDDVVSYLINPRWRPNDATTIYARIAKGYRPGGPNVLPPAAAGVAQPSFDSDSLINYEVGFKLLGLDNRLSLDAALFYIDWSEVQLTISQGGFSYMGNGGEAFSRGAEWAFSWRATEGLSLGFSGAYTQSELSKNAPGVGGRDGDRLPYVPEWSGAADADYRWPFGENWSAFVGTSYRYIGGRESNFGLQASRVHLPSYTLLDLRAGVSNGRWTISGYASNLGDKRGITSISTVGANAASNPYMASVIRPRTVGVTLALDF